MFKGKKSAQEKGIKEVFWTSSKTLAWNLEFRVEMFVKGSKKLFYLVLLSCWFQRLLTKLFRGVSRTPATSKMDFYMALVNR